MEIFYFWTLVVGGSCGVASASKTSADSEGGTCSNFISINMGSSGWGVHTFNPCIGTPNMMVTMRAA